MHNLASVLENNTHKHTNTSPNLGQKSRPYNNQQKKENLQNC